MKESVNKVLRENARPRRRINEVSAGLIKRSSDAAWDKGKKDQYFRFDNALSKKIIQMIADTTSFWLDFDESEHNLPRNWDDLDNYEKAKYVYDNSDLTDEEWLEEIDPFGKYEWLYNS